MFGYLDLIIIAFILGLLLGIFLGAVIRIKFKAKFVDMTNTWLSGGHK